MSLSVLGTAEIYCVRQGVNDLDELTCPITFKTFEDPVSAEDGHTYERSAITEWIDRATQGTPGRLSLWASRPLGIVPRRIVLAAHSRRVVACVCLSGEGAAVAQDGPAHGDGPQAQPLRQTDPGAFPRAGGFAVLIQSYGQAKESGACRFFCRAWRFTSV
jgi:hypothetical protein